MKDTDGWEGVWGGLAPVKRDRKGGSRRYVVPVERLGHVRVVTLLVIVLVFLLRPAAALANNGPHGSYGPADTSSTTSACAACHRAHSGLNENLLTAVTDYGLCTSCHGPTRAGANTDVIDGAYLERVPGAPLQGLVNDPLNGGGFLFYQFASSTSAHNVLGLPSLGNEAPGTAGTGKTAPAWGGGTAIGLSWNGGSPPASLTALQCISCHNPHGSESYRILRTGYDKPWSSATHWAMVAGETTPYSEDYTKGGSYDASSMSSWCATCHSNYTLHTSTYDAGDGLGAVTRHRHTVGYSPGCLTCHRSHGTSASMRGWASNVVPTNDSALLRLDNRAVCYQCHVKDGNMMGDGCDACHQSPPPTGTHQQHYSPTSAAQPAYGRTGNLSSGNQYTFGCGECHPTDHDQHANGVKNSGGGDAEIELYRNGYSLGLKSLNSSSATYTPGPTLFTDDDGFTYTLGTCSNVYCHSESQVVSSSAVSDPKTDAGGNLIRDANGNLTYDPYTVTITRQYRTMVWGASQTLGCNGCHGYPPRSYYPAVKAGVGQSHSWIDDQGYENLHNYNMSYAPLNCRVCHYDTVRAEYASYTRDAKDVATLADVPIYDASKHVNGGKDVKFDPVDPVNYGAYSYSLAGATWDPVQKTCSSVGCHLQQPKPQWGLPYRWENSAECDQCHRFR